MTDTKATLLQLLLIGGACLMLAGAAVIYACVRWAMVRRLIGVFLLAFYIANLAAQHAKCAEQGVWPWGTRLPDRAAMIRFARHAMPEAAKPGWYDLGQWIRPLPNDSSAWSVTSVFSPWTLRTIWQVHVDFGEVPGKFSLLFTASGCVVGFDDHTASGPL